MAEYDSWKVLQVPCPRCGAGEGEDCRTSKGKKTDHHTARKAVVYPAQYGGGRQGVKGSNKATSRADLRRAVIKAAMDWSGHGEGGAYPPEEEPQRSRVLFDACQALKRHRDEHPNIRG